MGGGGLGSPGSPSEELEKSLDELLAQREAEAAKFESKRREHEVSFQA